MGSAEIPYHPDADLTTDSLIRVYSCVTRLEKLRDVITEWLTSCVEPPGNGEAAGQICNPPACLGAIRRRIDITLRSIEKGRRRPSQKFVRAVGLIDAELKAHEHEFAGMGTRTDKAYGRRLRKALSEAVTLRDRLADQ